MTTKPTQDDLDLIARFCQGYSFHFDNDRARIRRLLNAYEAERASTQALREAAERLLGWLDNEAPDGLPAHESDYFSLDMRVSVIALRTALAALETKP
jgi:hypothetical protein